MRYLIIILCVLNGCITPAGEPGLCHVHAQAPKYTQNTKQNCTESAEARRIADLAQLLSIQVLAEEKIINYTTAVRDFDRGMSMVCLVPTPEPCCMSGSCVGPYNTDKTLAARKAGCSSAYHAWASLTWPPICNTNWPDEPHCVKTPEEQSSTGYDYKSTLAHEVFNMVVQRFTKVYDPSYQDKVYKVVEPIVQKRFKAALER